MEDQTDTLPPGPVRAPVPESLRHLAEVPELVSAWEAQLASRRAEASKIRHLLAYLDRCRAGCAGESVMVRGEAEKAAIRDAAVVLGLAERTTAVVLNIADFARSDLPRTWEAFAQGRIDLVRVRKIADAATVSSALSDGLIDELDSRGSVEAARRTVGDLQRWLTRCVADLDPQAYSSACEQAREDRYVRFDHQPNGMSYLEAYLPTMESAAIEKRLRAAARGLDSPPAHDCDDHTNQHEGTAIAGMAPDGAADRSGGDPRTMLQRQADLLSAWLRDGRVYTAPVEAKIMVMVPESTLTGESEQPGLSADRSWRLPADQIRTLAADPTAEHEWYEGRARRKPKDADFDLLSARYGGRYPPRRLRDALVFRDGTCQAPGCTVPAERCDMDHQRPWHNGGQTTAANLWALCRRHHRMKSHGYLHPPTQGSHLKPPLRRGSPTKSPPRPSLRATMSWASLPIAVKY